MKKRYQSIFFIILYQLSVSCFATSLSLQSPAFSRSIPLVPQKYTCEGKDISPALVWQNPPAKTQSFVLIVDDPDAPSGDWVHWVLFNIPANLRALPESAKTPTGAVSGQNSWNQSGYRGPCPPSGTHHYFFKLYALDKILNLDSTAKKHDVLNAMKNHVLETSELMGTYIKQN